VAEGQTAVGCWRRSACLAATRSPAPARTCHPRPPSPRSRTQAPPIRASCIASHLGGAPRNPWHSCSSSQTASSCAPCPAATCGAQRRCGPAAALPCPVAVDGRGGRGWGVGGASASIRGQQGQRRHTGGSGPCPLKPLVPLPLGGPPKRYRTNRNLMVGPGHCTLCALTGPSGLGSGACGGAPAAGPSSPSPPSPPPPPPPAPAPLP
jgi:hypothetical protein